MGNSLHNRWAWALDEARWQFRDVYRISDRAPYMSHL